MKRTIDLDQIRVVQPADARGRPLTEGARVEGWRDGIWYAGTVSLIRPHHPGCGDHRHITVIRDGSSAGIETFSNAVNVLSPDQEGQQ